MKSEINENCVVIQAIINASSLHRTSKMSEMRAY